MEKSRSRKKKHREKTKSSRYGNSDVERIEKRSGKKKWYSSDEYSSSESESSSDREEKKGRDNRKSRSKSKRSKGERMVEEDGDRSKKRSKCRQDGRRKSEENKGQEDIAAEDFSDSGRGTSRSLKEMEIVRKEMGLEWMLRPADRSDNRPVVTVDDKSEETPTEEIKKVHPKELNPFLKDNGSGYPEDTEGSKASGDQLLSSSVVGDGGASWRLKALKRAREQAAREGRRLEEVVEERWGSLGQLAVSVASRMAAPSRAHLHAIRDRRRGLTEEQQTGSDDQSETDIKKNDRRYFKDVSFQHHKMKEPKVRDSLSWGKRKNQNLSSKDAGLIAATVSSLNRFSNDGNFMHEIVQRQNNGRGRSVEGNLESEFASRTEQSCEGSGVASDALSANQLAAKALQLRLKGNHEEANKLLQEVEKIKQGAGDNSIRMQNEGSSSRRIMRDRSVRQKKDEDDADMHLARKIMHNKKYTTYGQADDEYDFEDGPSRKDRKKGGGNEQQGTQKNMRLLTQQERCLFCFENPKMPKHLIVSIANFTYLMLPQWQSVVPGHCCIVPQQHESATRTVEDNVWEEIRNFKKCLIMMFAKQEKDVVFLETVMGLAQQRRHCLIECIPLPREIAKQAPLYFKKDRVFVFCIPSSQVSNSKFAIDEAEDEWSQHNAKKLIDTSEKGLRGCIPKNFPYFHVEFGLNKGFVHVIDDEEQFKSSLGLNVIRGMLHLPEEDMYRRRRYESVEVQREAVKSFLQDWEPFDWTTQLHQAS
ncbi:CWF19-like protein 2 [Morella rubra]|uniref:CWF19-like protein 2 n=1 Tax=Morella rubra TaxID=262757 RepID=A0A6A1V0P9_9ROSI|nr:CWF19-like protein 2 [Morella rubra]KAB1206215.1 CWF19-like protein 2 [Morella rubra]